MYINAFRAYGRTGEHCTGGINQSCLSCTVPWKVSAFGCTTAEEVWAPLGRGQRGSSLMFPIRGFYAKLQQGALPSPWDRAAWWEISIINVRSGEGRGSRKNLNPLPPFLILLPSCALSPVTDLYIKVLFFPQDTEVAWTPAGNGYTGACRSLLLASRAVQVMRHSRALCSLTNSHGHHLVPMCLEDFQHRDRKVFNNWECRWAQVRRVWIWASQHALTQLFLVIHFPDPSLFPFFVSFLPCLCFLMPVQIVYSTVPDSLAERI